VQVDQAYCGFLWLPRFDGQVDYAAFRRGAWWICCSSRDAVEDRVCMEPIGSHDAILLPDRQLRDTLTSDHKARPQLRLSEVIRRAGSLSATLRGTLAKFRLATIVRTPAN
jgi:hypothetical protein